MSHSGKSSPTWKASALTSFAFTDTDTRTNFINVTALAADDSVLAERSFESFVDDVFTGTTDEDRFIGITADPGESIAKLLIGIDQGLGSRWTTSSSHLFLNHIRLGCLASQLYSLSFP